MRNPLTSRWAQPMAAFAFGWAVFGLSASHGGGLELLWLPAVMLAAGWPRAKRTVRNDCL